MKNDNANSETIKGSVNIPEMIINLNNEVEDSNISGKIVLSTISNGLTDKQIENINKIPTLEENISKLQTDENNLKDNVAEVQDNLNSLRSTVSQFEDCCNEEKKEIEYTGETIVINSGKESESEKINIKGKTINKISVGQAEGNLLIISSKGENLFNGLWNKYYYNSPWWNGQGLYKNENVSIAYMSNRIPCTLGKTYYANATNKNRFCVDFYKTMNESEIPFTGYGKTSTTDYYPVDSTVFTVKEPEAKYMEIYLGYDSVPTDVVICEYNERTIQLEDSLRSIGSNIYDEIIGDKLIKRVGTDNEELSKAIESVISGVTTKIFEGETTIEMSNELKGELTVRILEESSGTGGSDLTSEQINNINNIPNIKTTVENLDSRLTKSESDIKAIKGAISGGGSGSNTNGELVINFNAYGSTDKYTNSRELENAVKYVNSLGGGTILFDKLYKFDTNVATAFTLDNMSNITFKGINGGGWLKPGSNRIGFIRNCNNIKFIDMTISGSQSNLQSLVAGDYGVEVHGGENYLFEGCIFKNMRDACLVIGNESSIDPTGTVHTKNVTVTRCKFINCWQTSTTQNGVYNYWFANNYINGGATKFAQRLPNGDNIYILNNVYDVSDEFTGGIIEICNYDNVYVENNIIRAGKLTNTVINHYYNTHATTAAYQTHRNITIRGNKIYGGKTAMWINHDKQTYPAQRLIVEDNTLTGNIQNKAIQIGGYYDYIRIKNNYINDVNGAIGILFEGTITMAVIEDNTLLNMGKQSIQFNSGKISDLYIRRNIVHATSTLENILLNGNTSRLFIIDNTILSTASNANSIYFGGTNEMCRVVGNYINTKGSGIANISSSIATILNNHVISAGTYCIGFKSGSTGTAYTNANILSKSITLNGQTEVKL